MTFQERVFKGNYIHHFSHNLIKSNNQIFEIQRIKILKQHSTENARHTSSAYFQISSEIVDPIFVKVSLIVTNVNNWISNRIWDFEFLFPTSEGFQ